MKCLITLLLPLVLCLSTLVACVPVPPSTTITSLAFSPYNGTATIGASALLSCDTPYYASSIIMTVANHGTSADGTKRDLNGTILVFVVLLAIGLGATVLACLKNCLCMPDFVEFFAPLAGRLLHCFNLPFINIKARYWGWKISRRKKEAKQSYVMAGNEEAEKAIQRPSAVHLAPESQP